MNSNEDYNQLILSIFKLVDTILVDTIVKFFIQLNEDIIKLVTKRLKEEIHGGKKNEKNIE